MTSFLKRLHGWARGVLRPLWDILMPPLCLGCDAHVTENQTLCAACWKAIHFVNAPFCPCCGAPFDSPMGEGALCSVCLAETPAFTAARSVFLYDEASKPLLLRFKHADQLQGLPLFVQGLARAGEVFWPEVDGIVPVPLHRWRLLKRRYNQSALLATALGKRVQKRVLVDALVRERPTPPQGHFSKKQRLLNVRGAFALRGGVDVRGLKLIVVDDVMTSGATVNECARILLAAGAARVDVLTLARVKGAD
ncbi:MAG: ComF family protein [Bdellovibrionales bacterium]|jgi:ComF family protein